MCAGGILLYAGRCCSSRDSRKPSENVLRHGRPLRPPLRHDPGFFVGAGFIPARAALRVRWKCRGRCPHRHAPRKRPEAAGRMRASAPTGAVRRGRCPHRPVPQGAKKPEQGNPCSGWCERGDSNSHAIGHTHLKRACLPFQHSRISECLIIIAFHLPFVNWIFQKSGRAGNFHAGMLSIFQHF